MFSTTVDEALEAVKAAPAGDLLRDVMVGVAEQSAHMALWLAKVAEVDRSELWGHVEGARVVRPVAGLEWVALNDQWPLGALQRVIAMRSTSRWDRREPPDHNIGLTRDFRCGSPDLILRLVGQFCDWGPVLVAVAARSCHSYAMARVRVSTTVDGELLDSARRARADLNDAALLDAALSALLARERAAQIDASYRAYDEVPADAADEWGDLASFREAAARS